jgi:hypothetical protein
MANVQIAQERRLKSLTHPLWVDAMVCLIGALRVKYFRWHDSGDVQDIGHLRRIVGVAKRTPHINHWLPTREYSIIAKYRTVYGAFPDNLVVRLSAHMIDGDAPSGYGLPTSTVSSNGSATCPAPHQGNACQDCRACWEPNVPNVAYGLH